MKLCPLCDQPAISDHHIVPRSEGGTDEPRNIVKLCKKCHDEVEGMPFTPDLIERLRREKLGAKATSHELYWWLHKDEGVIFLGVEVPGRDLVHYNIFFPYDSQFTLPEQPLGTPLVDTKRTKFEQNDGDKKYSQRRGRPNHVITPEQRAVLESGGESVREKALKLGVTKRTVYRMLKELQAEYAAIVVENERFSPVG